MVFIFLVSLVPDTAIERGTTRFAFVFEEKKAPLLTTLDWDFSSNDEIQVALNNSQI